MRSCHWEVTRWCNLDCLHCLYTRSQMAEMDTLRCIEAVRALGSNSFDLICLTGGEPMTRADLPILLQVAEELGIQTAMITNGTLISQSNLGSISRLSGVCFSVDGIGPVHDQTRGQGSFGKLSAAIDLVESLGHVAISASITMTALNVSSLPEVLKWLCDKSISGIHINDLNLTGNALVNKDKLLVDWSKAAMQDLFETIESITGAAVVDHSSSCAVSAESICMSPSGVIYPCSEMMTARVGAICSLFDEDLEERYLEYFANVGQCRCMYTDYASGHISLTMRNGEDCPLLTGGV